MLVFGVLLYWMDQRARATRQIEDLTLRDAWILGLWQALALIPGTSRSGITITGALNAGFNRKEPAKIAMLMSIPTIIASGALTSLNLMAAQCRCATLLSLLPSASPQHLWPSV